MNGFDLPGMDGGLSGEAQARHRPCLVFEAGMVVHVEKWDIDRLHSAERGSVDDARARVKERVPFHRATELGGEIHGP